MRQIPIGWVIDSTEDSTIPTGSTYLYSKTVQFREEAESAGEATDISIYIQSADDDASTPSLELQYANYNGNDIMDIWHTLKGYSTSSPDTLVSSFNAGEQFESNIRQQDYYMPNRGINFRIKKTGAGAVTFSDSTLVLKWEN